MPSGYSSTPLYKKLGIKPGYKMILYNPPEHYWDLFGEFPENVVQAKRRMALSLDFAHLFCTTQKELELIFLKYKKAIKKNGMIWVSWPKGSSNIPTDLKREYIREYVLGQGLVDVKVAAVDENWSGLKFVYFLKDR